jgi:pimeloyl-ACP methyl ester carboxylesterase
MSSTGYQRVNGLRLFVHRFRDEAIQPSGLTIVLVHGFMDSGATWDLVAPALVRAGHDVVAPDLRGFGLSDGVGAGGYYHFPDYVADLAELIDALAPRRLAIVGHSMGGTIAALYVGAHPDRVERLALLEGMGPMTTEPSVAIDRMQAWLRGLRDVSKTPKPLTSLQEAVERLQLHHPRVAREIIETRAKLLTRGDDTGRLVWAYDPLHRTTAPTPFNADTFQAFLARIDCSTLVVSGGPAGWHPPDEADRIACLKHPVMFELPNAGHMMHWTEPAGLAHRLATFFGEPPPARTRPPMSSSHGIVEVPPHSGQHGPQSAHDAPGAGHTQPGMPPPSAVSPWALAAGPQAVVTHVAPVAGPAVVAVPVAAVAAVAVPAAAPAVPAAAAVGVPAAAPPPVGPTLQPIYAGAAAGMAPPGVSRPGGGPTREGGGGG